MTIIDTPTNLTSYAKRLVAAGVSTAIRYESRLPNAGWKRWQPDEFRAFQDAGLHAGIVYEDAGRPQGYQDGVEAATFALERCDARGQPDGSAILYSVDYDADVSDVDRLIVPYWHGVNDTHQKLRPSIRVGSYASGMVNRVLWDAKLVTVRWISCSSAFNGTAQALRDGAYELWQSHCDTHLLGIDADLNVAKVDDFGQFEPWGVPPAPAPVPFPSPPGPTPTPPPVILSHGKGSWYSQFEGKYHWHDSGDRPGSNALGVPDDCQGVSFYQHSTLGKWIELHAPNGVVSVEQQTEIGPAPWTGRGIDISAVCAERVGYSPSNFPTDAVFYWRPVLAPEPVRALSPRQQAIKWKQIRRPT